MGKNSDRGGGGKGQSQKTAEDKVLAETQGHSDFVNN